MVRNADELTEPELRTDGRQIPDYAFEIRIAAVEDDAATLEGSHPPDSPAICFGVIGVHMRLHL
jgi:hypothetical protein